MPTALAVKKCPASWTRIRSARPRMAMETFIRSSCVCESALHDTACLGIRLAQLGEIVCRHAVHGSERLLDYGGDLEEAEAADPKGRHCDLVGRVVRTGIRPAPL